MVSFAHLSEPALILPHVLHLPLALTVLVGSADLDSAFTSLPWSHDWKQKPLQGSEVRRCSATVELKATPRHRPHGPPKQVQGFTPGTRWGGMSAFSHGTYFSYWVITDSQVYMLEEV